MLAIVRPPRRPMDMPVDATTVAGATESVTDLRADVDHGG
jgi:hypothetical protein